MAELLARTRTLLGSRALLGPALLLFLAALYGWRLAPLAQALVETWIVLRLAAQAGWRDIRGAGWLLMLFALLLVRALIAPLGPAPFAAGPFLPVGGILVEEAIGGGGWSIFLLGALMAVLGNLLLHLAGRPVFAGLFGRDGAPEGALPARARALALLALLGVLAALPATIGRLVPANGTAMFLLASLIGVAIDVLTLATLVAALLPFREAKLSARPGARATTEGRAPATAATSPAPRPPAAPAMPLRTRLWLRLRDAWRPALALLIVLPLAWVPPAGLFLLAAETWLVLRLFAVCRHPEVPTGLSLLAAAGAVLVRAALIGLLAMTGAALALGAALSDQAAMPGGAFNALFLTLIFGGVALGNLAALALLGRLRPWLAGRTAVVAPLPGWLAVAAIGLVGAAASIFTFDLAQRLSDFGQKPGLGGILPFLLPLIVAWLSEILGWGLAAAFLTRDCTGRDRP